VALDVFPSSRELHVIPGETASFAVQAKSASGEAVDDAEVFFAADESAPFTFEVPSSDTKSARASTKRDTVTSLSVDGVVQVRIAVGSAAAAGVYPVFCGLTAVSSSEDASAGPHPVARVNIVVDEPDGSTTADSSVDADASGGADAS
jgi:hypothetical protein